MSDEQQLRTLLAEATQLPDEVQPPIQQLLRLGRRRQNLRTWLLIATAAAVVVAAVTVPSLVRTFDHGAPGPSQQAASLFSGVPLPAQSGPTTAQLSGYHWSTLPPSPLGNRTTPMVAWAGTELIHLVPSNLSLNPTLRGAAFSPATGRWHPIASVKLDPGSWGSHPTVWTGHELFIVSGQFKCTAKTVSSCHLPAALYDPATNHWTNTQLPSQMSQLAPEAAVWTGRYIVVAADGINGPGLGVAAYNPATGRWQMITPRLPPGHRCLGVSMVATSDRVIVWSLWRQTTHTPKGVTHSFGVDVLASSRASNWSDVTGSWPQHETVYDPVFTGHGILTGPNGAWCGPNCGGNPTMPATFADPYTLHRTIIPAGPIGLADVAYTWADRTVIAYNLSIDACHGSPPAPIDRQACSVVAVYDPDTGIWRSLPAPPDGSGLLALPVWTGSELLVLTSSGKLLAFGR